MVSRPDMNPLVSLGEFKASLKRAGVVLTEAEVKKVKPLLSISLLVSHTRHIALQHRHSAVGMVKGWSKVGRGFSIWRSSVYLTQLIFLVV